MIQNLMPNINWQSLKYTSLVRALSLAKIPLIAFLWPKIITITDDKIIAEIPLSKRAKNHLNSMYFGALSIGADMAIGILATKHIRESAPEVALVFKDFKADFLKRAEGDVHFVCEEGQLIKEMVIEAAQTGERVSKPIHAKAFVPQINPNEAVATFILTLSVKKRR